MPPVKALVLDGFDRAAPRGTGHAKAGANYAGSFRWVKQAKAGGSGLTLHLDCVQHEDIEEFSTSGFLGIRTTKRQADGAGTGISADSSDITLVVPDSPAVLPSLTSDSVQRIAGSLGWAVEHRRVPYGELPYFDEVVSVGTGTGTGLVPVRSISRRAGAGAGPLLTSGMPGHAAARLRVSPDGPETLGGAVKCWQKILHTPLLTGERGQAGGGRCQGDAKQDMMDWRRGNSALVVGVSRHEWGGMLGRGSYIGVMTHSGGGGGGFLPPPRPILRTSGTTPSRVFLLHLEKQPGFTLPELFAIHPLHGA